ncbi:unnamed protein product [Musa textilis]
MDSMYFFRNRKHKIKLNYFSRKVYQSFSFPTVIVLLKVQLILSCRYLRNLIAQDIICLVHFPIMVKAYWLNMVKPNTISFFSCKCQLKTWIKFCCPFNLCFLHAFIFE